MPKDSQPGNRSERSSARPARDRLLDAVVAHFARHGVGAFSLRGLAAELGTSHRMVIYHFGSKDGLLVAVVRRVEAEQRAARRSSTWTPPTARRTWPGQFHRHLSAADHWPARLFFELTGQALAATRTPTAAGRHRRRLAAPSPSSAGVPAAAEEARAHARLALAVARGLLFDLLATGDRDAVDAAAEASLVSYETVSPSGPSARSPG